MKYEKKKSGVKEAVQAISQRAYRSNRASNRLIAAAAIIIVVLISATCSAFFNPQSFPAPQDLKSYGATTDSRASKIELAESLAEAKSSLHSHHRVVFHRHLKLYQPTP